MARGGRAREAPRCSLLRSSEPRGKGNAGVMMSPTHSCEISVVTGTAVAYIVRPNVSPRMAAALQAPRACGAGQISPRPPVAWSVQHHATPGRPSPSMTPIREATPPCWKSMRPNSTARVEGPGREDSSRNPVAPSDGERPSYFPAMTKPMRTSASEAGIARSAMLPLITWRLRSRSGAQNDSRVGLRGGPGFGHIRQRHRFGCYLEACGWGSLQNSPDGAQQSGQRDAPDPASHQLQRG